MKTIRQIFGGFVLLAIFALGTAAQDGLSISEQIMHHKARSYDMGPRRGDSQQNGVQTSTSGVTGEQADWLCFQTGCVYLFGQGRSLNARAVYGTIFKKWVENGHEAGKLGYPLADEKSCTGADNAAFRYQEFEGGKIYWKAATDIAIVFYPNQRDFPCGASPRAGHPAGGSNSVVATPVGGSSPAQGTPAAAIAVSTQEEMKAVARKLKLGEPRADSRGWANPTESGSTAKKIKGWFLCYETGCVYYSEIGRIHAVYGTIMKKWGEAGWERGKLGFPVSDEQDCYGTGDKRDRYQVFQSGQIYWQAATDTATVYVSKDQAFPCRPQPASTTAPSGSSPRVIGEAYSSTANTPAAITVAKQSEMEALARNYNLGNARADTANGAKTTISGYNKSGGWFLCFERGCVYYSQIAGTHAVYGTIFQKWVSLGYEHGSFGFPTTEELSCSGTRDSRDRYQRFEGGVIYWRAADNATAIFDKDQTKLPCY